MATGRRLAVNAGGDVLYESDRTRVTRVRSHDGTGSLIRKEALGADAVERRRHERAILERLTGLAGVPELVRREGDEAIVSADEGGVDLENMLTAGPLDPAEAIDLALELAAVLASVHRRGVVHKDITPANVLLAGVPRGPRLIDFDLATTFAEERPAFTHQNQIVGTLAYLAPEQTGRTARSVDQRADLYGLGATLYEAATGGPPFGFGDPLRLTHDHLARVPVPPVEANPAVPPLLSDIILRLLEKEPDRRYQSAEGLVHDLARLRDALGGREPATFPLGERDFPTRLVPPSRLVGRDTEIAALRAAFDEMMAGRGCGLLVSGGPGVGKTSLIDELRPHVTGRGGWLVSGKFDQYRRDLDSDGTRQAMRALCRLLLAEPEQDVAALRIRLRALLGANAGLVVTVVPELATLIDVAPDAAAPDPMTTERRLIQAGLDILRAVVSPDRPVVLVLDDLQWAGSAQISFIDAVLTDPELSGLLLVGAYRDAEIDEAHSLTATLSRWAQLDPAPARIQLANLPPSDLGDLLAEMLRLSPDRSACLAEALVPRTGGNPYDTVEVVNSLRREGVLVPGRDGWHWDGDAVRRHVGRADVVELLLARVDALPPSTRELLEMMAVLGSELTVDLLATAAGGPVQVVEEGLLPALEDGLLMMDRSGAAAVRFRHDRVQEAAFVRLTPETRPRLQLTLARRLASVPEYWGVAAEQYLPAVGGVIDRDERLRVAELFRDHAAALRVVNPVIAERLLDAALALAGGDRPVAGEPLLTLLEIDHHTALYALGRMAEADEVYESIVRRRPAPEALAVAACTQIPSLVNRGRGSEAMTVGLDLLGRLGVPMPAPDALGAEIGAGLIAGGRWVADNGPDADLDRPDVTDPRVLAAARLVTSLTPAAYISAPHMYGWLVVEAWRLWIEHGPCAELVVPVGNVAFIGQAAMQEFRAGYTVARHMVTVADARGYVTAPNALLVLTSGAAHWFERLEDVIAETRRAHEGLLRAGDPHMTAYCRNVLGILLVDGASTLTDLITEVEAGIAYANRTGNIHVIDMLLPIRQLARALRGETEAPDSFTDEAFDEAAFVPGLAANPPAALMFHAMHGIAEIVCGQMSKLTAHAAAVGTLLPGSPGLYSGAIAQLLRGIALAEQVRAGGTGEDVIAGLAACHGWLAARAVDAPANFAHVAHLAEAEQAWALGDRWAAARAFDAAIRTAGEVKRPWHRALIHERAALFHTAHGLEHTGRILLAEARRAYELWGATAKVRLLDASHPDLPGMLTGHDADHRRSISISTDTIDLLAVLNASQALSSETNLDRLRARVTESLGAMTGATDVRLLLHHADTDDWHLPAESGVDMPLAEAGARGLIPLSVVRYVERMREPLAIDDATRDDRFRHDPHLAGLEQCSLLAMPIFAGGSARAMLLLENRLSRGAFTAERLSTVALIAGQLAVSLDNAMVYASLERKVAERTEALAIANARLERLAVTDTLTGLANRRRLAEILDAEWRRAVRYRTTLAVAMIDVDHFKGYNDHYGHAGGDECLRRVALSLAESVRNTDYLARYGGEEFMVVLPETDLAGALIVAERVRANIEILAEPHAVTPRGIVTVSIGISAVEPSVGQSVDDLVKAADVQLYNAKREGRNRVASG